MENQHDFRELSDNEIDVVSGGSASGPPPGYRVNPETGMLEPYPYGPLIL